MIPILIGALVGPHLVSALLGAVADKKEGKKVDVGSILKPVVLIASGPGLLALLAGPTVADAVLAAPLAQARERKTLLDWMRDQKLGVMPLSDNRRDWGLIHVDELPRWERTGGKDPAQLSIIRARRLCLGPIFATVPELRRNYGIGNDLALDDSWG